MHYIYAILIFILMIIMGIIASFFLYQSTKTNDKKESNSYNTAIVIFALIAVGCFFWGKNEWSANGSKPSGSQVSQQFSSGTTAASTNSIDNNADTGASSSQTDNSTGNTSIYSVTNPAPDSYLKDYMSFMDQYYKQIHNIVHDTTHKTVDEGSWSFILANHNKDGWDKYHQIDYQTEYSVEKHDQFQKRTDVYLCWSLLSSLSMDYDQFLRGSGNLTAQGIEKEENDYEQQYSKTLEELK